MTVETGLHASASQHTGAATQRTAKSRRATASPLLVAIVAYGLSGPSLPFAGVLAVLALLALILTAHVRLGKMAQIMVSMLLLVGGIAMLVTLLPRAPTASLQLRTGWAAFAGSALLVAVMRLYLANPVGGDLGTVAVALCAMAACGGTPDPGLYAWLVFAFVLATLVARRYCDAGHAPLGSLTLRYLVPMGAGAGVAVLVAQLWVGWLPQMHDRVVRELILRGVRSGFSENMFLGSMRGMLQSEKPVMRIRGPATDHLRGIVYTQYHAGRWTRTKRDAMRIAEPPTTLVGDDVTQIEFVDSQPERYFLPLDATEVAVSSGVARVDRAAIVAPVAAKPASLVWFRTGAREERWRSVAPPTDEDIDFPPAMHAALHAVVQRWTRPEWSDAEKLNAIATRLQNDYTYSLDYERSVTSDPVLQFLTVDREGHCEYFASAMALLSRTMAIPARVVGGYRVSEFNTLGGYYLVREQNAHAWVEVWVGGRWQTIDPTPQADLPQAETTPWSGALVDVLGHGWATFLHWLDARTPAEMVVTPVLLIVIAFGVRWLRPLRRRQRGSDGEDTDPPLPCFERLSQALAARGVARSGSETLEALARRLDDTELSAAEAELTSKLLLRYAALRYGGHGDRRSLDLDMTKWAQRLQSG